MELAIQPLLTIGVTTRSGGDELPGSYNSVEKVWIVETQDGPQPIVQISSELSEAKTLTEVRRERPDFDSTLLELSTKTSTMPERDDYRATMMTALLDLVTTTKIESERTDR